MLRLGARHEDELEARDPGSRRDLDRGAVGREGLVEEREALIGAELVAGRGGGGLAVRIVGSRGERQDARRGRGGCVRERRGEHAVDEHVAHEARDFAGRAAATAVSAPDAGGVRAAGAKLTRSSGRRLAYFQFSSRVPGSPVTASVSMAARRRAAPGSRAASARTVLACCSAMRAARGVLIGASGRLAAHPVVAAPLELERQRAIAAAAMRPRTSTCTKSGTMYSSRRW